MPQDSRRPVDFDFLAAQTFADLALEREVLELFVAQARKVLPKLPNLSAKEQADTAHLLKGSARGIGAWAAAEAAEAYEAASAEARPRVWPDLTRAFAAASDAIAIRLSALQS